MASGPHECQLQVNLPLQFNLPRSRASIRPGLNRRGMQSKGGRLATITMKELLEAGVHFGHQTKRWDPRMKEYIFGERNGIYIIDLQKTLKMFKEASKFVTELAAPGQGHPVRRHQAPGPGRHRGRSDPLRHVLHQPALAGWVAHQLGHRAEVGEAPSGTRRYGHRRPLRPPHQEGSHQASSASASTCRPTWPASRTCAACPTRIFVVDSNNEAIAVKEARKLGIPVVAVVDTNCDPTVVDYVIPGNDDALRAIRLFTSKISDSVVEGVQTSTDKQFADAIAGVTALTGLEARRQEAEAAAVPKPSKPAARLRPTEPEEVDLEAALGGGIRKAPASVAAAEPTKPRRRSSALNMRQKRFAFPKAWP